jgi:hypothetical protein
MLIGKFLTIAGMSLLAGWAYYFIHLIRPLDLWDASPIPVAVTTILVGIKLVRYSERQRSHSPSLLSK